jgi:hypothetical protein
MMSVNILDMENTNTSDHVPRIANMECHLLRRKEKQKLLKLIRWLFLAFLAASAIPLFHIDFTVGF